MSLSIVFHGCGDVEKYKQYIGFHGTTVENAENILKEKKFRPSTKLDEWLGKGIYFFAYPEDAEWWCKTYRRLGDSSSAILQVEIKVESVIDLLGSKKDIEAFKFFCEKIKNICPRLPDGRQRSNYMTPAIKLMLKNQEYRRDMIIGGFERNRHSWYKERDDERKYFPLVIAQVQYCICNHDCIKNIGWYQEGAQNYDE